jgi:hypothetical protein
MGTPGIEFQSDFLSYIDRSSLPPADTTETDTSALRAWTTDREAQKLVKLAYALGVGIIVLADRDISESYLIGQYICAHDSHETHQKQVKPWCLFPKQLATVNRTLCSGRDVILLSHESSGRFSVILSHEIGHRINRLGGLNPFEPAEFSRVTNNMRRVARFDEYCFQNKDEYYAETWSRFLCGEKNRALFRYLDRPFNRLRSKHPEKARLIEEYRKRALAA